VITDIIVLSSLAFALAFGAAWLCSPGLRAWIERPKHRFHEAATEYDQRILPADAGSHHGDS
jgi:hypothetical protein